MRPVEPERYDVPPELEGENSGLVELVAQYLWQYRTQIISPLNRKRSWDEMEEPVKKQWRDTARHVLGLLFNIGFVGPAGEPRHRFDDYTYGWNYVAATWQITDADNGYVALVNETADLALMLAAPRMRSAIKDLLAAIPPDHPSRQTKEMLDLEHSLPDEEEEPPEPVDAFDGLGVLGFEA